MEETFKAIKKHACKYAGDLKLGEVCNALPKHNLEIKPF